MLDVKNGYNLKRWEKGNDLISNLFSQVKMDLCSYDLCLGIKVEQVLIMIK